MLKKFFKLAGIGFLSGIVLCMLICVIFGDGMPVDQSFVRKVGSLRAAMLLEMCITGLYGAINLGTVIIYDNEKLPLLAASVLHGSIVILPFIPMGFLLGWEKDIITCLIMTGCQIAGYFFIWLIIYLNYRKEIKKLNDLQMQMQTKKRIEGSKKGLQDK